MSTRGKIILKYNNIEKITYNHYDSYPEGLGINLKNEIQNCSINQLIDTYNKIIMVSDFDENINNDELKKKVKEKLNITDDSLKFYKYSGDWYSILHKFQGTLRPYINNEIEYMYDGSKETGEEYIYIINLDDKTFECYSVTIRSNIKFLLHKFDLGMLKSISDDQFIKILRGEN